MKVKIYNPEEKKPENIIFPIQTHSTNIIEIKTGRENLENCDGIFTSIENDFLLGVKTADCAAIAFWDNKNYGILHAGWRGLVDGIIEKMLKKFENPQIFMGPFYGKFEITKGDDCYKRIERKFGNKFFSTHTQSKKVYFDFKSAVKSVVGEKAVFDPRDTFEDKSLASWRRDKTEKRNFAVIENI